MENLSGVNQSESREAYLPRCDIYERQDAIVVLADMPGVDEKGAEVRLEKNVLELIGRVNKRSERHRYERCEYGEGDYYRNLRLSDGIDTERIEASMKNGVLRVVLPKSQKHRPRKIEVKSA